MKTIKQLCVLFTLLILPGMAPAADDLALHQLTDNVYAIVGELGNRSPENLGNNATFGFVVTPAGVLLIDPGGSYRGAQRLQALIKTVTDQPVVMVINSGGQDHRWLGNGYFKQQGARVIASERAVADQRARSRDQLIALADMLGAEGLAGTEASYADQTFTDQTRFTLGGTAIEIHHAGQAHTPGDSFVWLPGQRVMFSGDIVYTERMLGVGSQSNSKSWIEVYETMAAFAPAALVPGHGRPTTLERADADTYGYLKFLRQQVTEFYENGGDLSKIGTIDQSRYSYLQNFDNLAGRNAQQVFTELEWE